MSSATVSILVYDPDQKSWARREVSALHADSDGQVHATFIGDADSTQLLPENVVSADSDIASALSVARSRLGLDGDESGAFADMIVRSLGARFETPDTPEQYSNLGRSVISLNPCLPYPFQHTADNSDEALRRRVFAGDGTAAPANAHHPPAAHVWNVAIDAHAALVRDESDQSIVVSGISGSGKTECAKLLLRCLAALSHRAAGEINGRDVFAARLEAASTVLEAFGNAPTSRHSNSSRFVKNTVLTFDPKGVLAKAHVTAFPIGFDIVTPCALHHHAGAEEPPASATAQTFHIFRLLFADDAPLQGKGFPADFVEGVRIRNPVRSTDGDQRQGLVEALQVLGVSVGDVGRLFDTVLAIAHLLRSDISDDTLDDDADDADDAARGPPSSLDEAARLLGGSITGRELREMLSQHAKSRSKFSEGKRVDTRDGFCRLLYVLVFQHVVRLVNSSLGPARVAGTVRCLTLVDPCGFESSRDGEANAIDQLLINFADEHLATLAAREEIVNPMLDANARVEGFNSKDACGIDTDEFKHGRLEVLRTFIDELVNAKRGDVPVGEVVRQIVEQCDDESMVAEGGDATFAVRSFLCSPNRPGFVYDANDLIAKSAATTAVHSQFHTLLRDMRERGDAWLAALVPLPTSSRKSRPRTSDFADSFRNLCLQLSGALFVHCIETNAGREQWVFNPDDVRLQVEAARAHDVAAVELSGFPVRRDVVNFAAMITNGLSPEDNAKRAEANGRAVDAISVVAQRCGVSSELESRPGAPHRRFYAIGKEKAQVFLTTAAFDALVAYREANMALANKINALESDERMRRSALTGEQRDAWTVAASDEKSAREEQQQNTSTSPASGDSGKVNAKARKAVSHADPAAGDARETDDASPTRQPRSAHHPEDEGYDTDTKRRAERTRKKNKQLSEARFGRLDQWPLDPRMLLAHGCVFHGPTKSELFNRHLFLVSALRTIGADGSTRSDLDNWLAIKTCESNHPLGDPRQPWKRVSRDVLERTRTAAGALETGASYQSRADVMTVLVNTVSFWQTVASHLDGAVHAAEKAHQNKHTKDVSARSKCPEPTWESRLDGIKPVAAWLKDHVAVDASADDINWQRLHDRLFLDRGEHAAAVDGAFTLVAKVCEYMVPRHVWVTGPVPDPRRWAFGSDMSVDTVHFLHTDGDDTEWKKERDEALQAVAAANIVPADDSSEASRVLRRAVANNRRSVGKAGPRCVGHALHLMLQQLELNETRASEVIRSSAALFAMLRTPPHTTESDDAARKAVEKDLRRVGLHEDAVASVVTEGGLAELRHLRHTGEWETELLAAARSIFATVVEFSAVEGADSRGGLPTRDPEWGAKFEAAKMEFVRHCQRLPGCADVTSLDAAVDSFVNVGIGSGDPVTILTLMEAVSYDLTAQGAPAEAGDGQPTAGYDGDDDLAGLQLEPFRLKRTAAIAGAKEHGFLKEGEGPLAQQQAAARYMVAFLRVPMAKHVFRALVLLVLQLDACAATARNSILRDVPNASVIHVPREALCRTAARCGAATFYDLGFRLDGFYTIVKDAAVTPSGGRSRHQDADDDGVASALQTYTVSWEGSGAGGKLDDAIRRVCALQQSAKAAAATRRGEEPPMVVDDGEEVMIVSTMPDRSESVRVRCRVDSTAQVKYLSIDLGGNQQPLECEDIVAHDALGRPFLRIGLFMDGASVLPWRAREPRLTESAAMLAEAIRENEERSTVAATVAGDEHFEDGIEFLGEPDDGYDDGPVGTASAPAGRADALAIHKSIGYRVSVDLRRSLESVDRAVTRFWDRELANGMGPIRHDLRDLLPCETDRVRCLMLAEEELADVEEFFMRVRIQVHRVGIDDQSFAAKFEHISALAQQPGYAIALVSVDGHVNDKRIDRLLAIADGTGLRFLVIASLSTIAFARDDVVRLTAGARAAITPNVMKGYDTSGAVGALTLSHTDATATDGIMAELECAVSSRDTRDQLALAALPWRDRAAKGLRDSRVVVVCTRNDGSVTTAQLREVAQGRQGAKLLEDLRTTEDQASCVEEHLRSLGPSGRLLCPVVDPAISLAMPSCRGNLVPAAFVETRHSLPDELRRGRPRVAVVALFEEEPPRGMLALVGCTSAAEFTVCMREWRAASDPRCGAIEALSQAPELVPFACFVETHPVCEFVDQRLRVHLYLHACGAPNVPEGLAERVSNVHCASLWDSFAGGRANPAVPQRASEYYATSPSYATGRVGGTQRSGDVLESALRRRGELDWNEVQALWKGGSFEYSESFLLRAVAGYHQPLKLLAATGAGLFHTLEGTKVRGPAEVTWHGGGISSADDGAVPWATEVLRRLLDPAVRAALRHAVSKPGGPAHVGFESSLKWLLLSGGAVSAEHVENGFAITAVDLVNVDAAGIVMVVAGPDCALDASTRAKVLQVVVGAKGAPGLFLKQVRLRDFFCRPAEDGAALTRFELDPLLAQFTGASEPGRQIGSAFVSLIVDTKMRDTAALRKHWKAGDAMWRWFNAGAACGGEPPAAMGDLVRRLSDDALVHALSMCGDAAQVSHLVRAMQQELAPERVAAVLRDCAGRRGSQKSSIVALCVCHSDANQQRRSAVFDALPREVLPQVRQVLETGSASGIFEAFRGNRGAVEPLHVDVETTLLDAFCRAFDSAGAPVPISLAIDFYAKTLYPPGRTALLQHAARLPSDTEHRALVTAALWVLQPLAPCPLSLSDTNTICELARFMTGPHPEAANFKFLVAQEAESAAYLALALTGRLHTLPLSVVRAYEAATKPLRDGGAPLLPPSVTLLISDQQKLKEDPDTSGDFVDYCIVAVERVLPQSIFNELFVTTYTTSENDFELDVSSGLSPTTVARNLSCLARTEFRPDARQHTTNTSITEANLWFMHAVAVLWFASCGVPPFAIPSLVDADDSRPLRHSSEEAKNVRAAVESAVGNVVAPDDKYKVQHQDVMMPLPTYIDTHLLQTSPFLRLFSNDTPDNVAYTFQTVSSGLAGLDEAPGDVVVDGSVVKWPTLADAEALLASANKTLHLVFARLTGARLAVTWGRLIRDGASREERTLVILGALSGVFAVWTATDRESGGPAVAMHQELVRVAVDEGCSPCLAGTGMRGARYELAAGLVGAVGFTTAQRPLLKVTLEAIDAAGGRVSNDMLVELNTFLRIGVLADGVFDLKPWADRADAETDVVSVGGPPTASAKSILTVLKDFGRETGANVSSDPDAVVRPARDGGELHDTSGEEHALFVEREGNAGGKDQEATLSIIASDEAEGADTTLNLRAVDVDDAAKTSLPTVIDVTALLAVKGCIDTGSDAVPFFSDVFVRSGADCAVINEHTCLTIVSITDKRLKHCDVVQVFADHGKAWRWCLGRGNPLTLVARCGLVLYRADASSGFAAFLGEWDIQHGHHGGTPASKVGSASKDSALTRVWHVVAYHDVLGLERSDEVRAICCLICRAIASGLAAFANDELTDADDMRVLHYLCDHTDDSRVLVAHDTVVEFLKHVFSSARAGSFNDEKAVSIIAAALHVASTAAELPDKDSAVLLGRCFPPHIETAFRLAMRKVSNATLADVEDIVMIHKTYVRAAPIVAHATLVAPREMGDGSAMEAPAADHLSKAMAYFTAWIDTERKQQQALKAFWEANAGDSATRANALSGADDYAFDVVDEPPVDSCIAQGEGTWKGPPLHGGVQRRAGSALQFIVSRKLLSSPFIFERRPRPEPYDAAQGQAIGWIFDRRYTGATAPHETALPGSSHFAAERAWLLDVMAAPISAQWKRWLAQHMYLRSAQCPPGRQDTVVQCLATRHQEAMTQSVLVNAIADPLPMCTRKNRLYGVIAITSADFAQHEGPLAKATVRLRKESNRTNEEKYREIIGAFNPRSTHVVVHGLDTIPDLMLKWCCEYTKRYPWRFIVLLDCVTFDNLPENRDRVQNFIRVNDETISRPRVTIDRFQHSESPDFATLAREAFGATYHVTSETKKMFEWTEFVTAKIDTAVRLVLHLVSAPGAGKSYLMDELRERAEKEAGSAFRFFDCSDDRLCEVSLGELLNEAISGVPPGKKLVLVADEYHLLEAKKKYEFLNWIASANRLDRVKVVMIANRADEIDDRSLKELRTITASHEHGDAVVEVYGRISSAKVRFVAQKTLKLPTDAKRTVAVSKIVVFYSALRNLLADDAVTFRFLDVVPFREEADPEAAALAAAMSRELRNKMIRVGSVTPAAFVRNFGTLWEQLKMESLLPGMVARRADFRDGLRAVLLSLINGSPLRLLTFVAMLPALAEYDPDGALQDGIAPETEAAATAADKAVDQGARPLTASQLYRTYAFDRMLSYKELMGRLPSTFRAHPFLRLASWVEFTVTQSLGPAVLQGRELNDMLATLRRMTLVDQTDFPIVLDERSANATLRSVESVYKKGDDLTDLDWIYDCVKRGQAVNWEDIKLAWAANPVTNGAKLQAILNEVAKSVVFDALTKRNVMQLLRKSADIRDSVLGDYPAERIAVESNEFVCPYYYALWADLVSQPDHQAWARDPLARVLKHLSDPRLDSEDQGALESRTSRLTGRLLHFMAWVSAYGALVTTVPNATKTRTECVRATLVALTERAVTIDVQSGARDFSKHIDALVAIWSTPYFAPLCDITALPLDIAFAIAGRRNPPVAEWPYGMKLLNKAAAASNGGPPLSVQDATALVTVFKTTENANQPPRLIGALLQTDPPGWLEDTVTRALLASPARVEQDDIVLSRTNNIERNVLAAAIAGNPINLQGLVRTSLIDRALETRARSKRPNLRDTKVEVWHRVAGTRMARGQTLDYSFYNNDAVFKKGSYKDAKLDKFGNAAGDFDLCKDGSFKGFRILFCELYNCECEKRALPQLRKKGFEVTVVATLVEFVAKLDPTAYHQAWLLSTDLTSSYKHPMPANVQTELVDKALAFHRAGRGLMLLADNDPFYAHVNPILNKLFGFTVVGNTPGRKVLSPGDAMTPQHFSDSHLLTTGLKSIYEGVTICYPNRLPKSFGVIGTSSDKQPVLIATQDAYATPKAASPYGRVVVDCGFTKLMPDYFDSTAGTARYVSNCAAWLCMREKFEEADWGASETPAPWPAPEV